MKAILSGKSGNENDLRVDIAWNLFYQDKKSITALPRGNSHYLFVRWLWESIGQRTGPLKEPKLEKMRIVIPELDKASLEFLVRVISPWFEEVYMEKDGSLSEDLWTFPVSSLTHDDKLDEAENSLVIRGHHGQDQRFLMPLLGPSRVFARIEMLPAGGVSARLHSHSSVDEYYLILGGEGTLRMNGKERKVSEGDFIAKPYLPEATSQILANTGKGIRILDIEVWQDNTISSKDLVYYPDHGEFLMRGTGWGSMIPSDSSMPADDLGKNYDTGYVRQKDGSWVGKEIAGHQKRVRGPSER